MTASGFSGERTGALTGSLNLKRRHLDPSQKAFVGADAERLLAVDAKKRMLAPLMRGNEKPARALLPERERRARDDAAKLVGVSARYIQDAKRIQRDAPELLRDAASPLPRRVLPATAIDLSRCLQAVTRSPSA